MLKVSATIVKVETMADKGMKLTVHTQELKPSDKAELMELDKKFGWFVFSETNIEASDIPANQSSSRGKKHSQTFAERAISSP